MAILESPFAIQGITIKEWYFYIFHILYTGRLLWLLSGETEIIIGNGNKDQSFIYLKTENRLLL